MNPQKELLWGPWVDLLQEAHDNILLLTFPMFNSQELKHRPALSQSTRCSRQGRRRCKLSSPQLFQPRCYGVWEFGFR